MCLNEVIPDLFSRLLSLSICLSTPSNSFIRRSAFATLILRSPRGTFKCLLSLSFSPGGVTGRTSVLENKRQFY